MVEGEAVSGGFFITNLEFAEVVEPAMRHFDDPAARFEAFVLFGLEVFAAWTHVRQVAMRADDGSGLFANVAGIGTKIFRHSFGLWLVDKLAVKHGCELADIVAIGAHQHKSQRDPFLIHQKVSPAAVFFPGRLGFDQPHHRPSGL